MTGRDFDDLIFPARRYKYVFFVRMFALIVMILALATYAAQQIAEPTAAFLAALFSTPEATTTSQVQALPAAPDAVATVAPPETAELSSGQDSSGILAQDALVSSDDGLAVLRLLKGTKVLDAQGKPLPPTSITVTAYELPLRTDIALVGMAYEFSPQGVTVSPSTWLTIGFNPYAFYPFRYQDVNCSRMHIAYYDANAPTIYNNSKGAPITPWLNSNMDLVSHSVFAKIDHLGTMILFCEVFGPPIS